MSNETKLETLINFLDTNNVKYNLYGTHITEYELVIYLSDDCIEIDFSDTDEVIDSNIDYVMDKITREENS